MATIMFMNDGNKVIGDHIDLGRNGDFFLEEITLDNGRKILIESIDESPHLRLENATKALKEIGFEIIEIYDKRVFATQAISQEPNNWLPIDDKTPFHRPILVRGESVFYDGGGGGGTHEERRAYIAKCTGIFGAHEFVLVDATDTSYVNGVTGWMELPQP